MPLERASVRDSNRDTQPLLSIVVAAYNIEGYIEEALESLLSQPLIDRMKIIVVDDGSTDDTYAAARSVAERDSGAHIELLHQTNAGLSAARNTGLAAVRTPYVGFLDGDDIYLQGFSETVIPLLEEGAWDLLEYNVKIIDDDGKHLDDIQLVQPGAGGGHDIGREERRHFADQFHNFAWARLYRTELYKGVTFPLGRIYEDMATMPQLFLRAKTIYRVASPLIGYRRRFGSITQKAALRDMRDLRTNGIEALARCDGSELDDYWLTVFDRLFQRARHVCARVDHGSFRQATEVLSAMSSDHRKTCTTLAARDGRKVETLSAFDLNLRADRSIFFLKGLVKKVLRRSLDHHARERRPAVSRQLSGSARGQ
jgi:glycosyltransferase involved in cell wall biosynthesis